MVKNIRRDLDFESFEAKLASEIADSMTPNDAYHIWAEMEQ